MVAGVLLILTELTHIRYVTTLTASCDDLAGPRLRDSCLIVGHESHYWGFAILGLFVALMAFGAAVGRSRPAAYALTAAGAVALGITLIHDLPDTTSSGQVGAAFADAKAHAGAGFWLELVGSVLALGAGVFALLRRPGIRAVTIPPEKLAEVEEVARDSATEVAQAIDEASAEEAEAPAAEAEAPAPPRREEARERERAGREARRARRGRVPRERERRQRAAAEQADEKERAADDDEVTTDETEAVSAEEAETQPTPRKRRFRWRRSGRS